MQVVLLAGGLGTRLSEETDLIPKPMVKIGPDPIILHIMKYYASYGHKNFLVAAGYKGEIVKDYFETHLHGFKNKNGWTINVVDTGLSTGTGGRLLKLMPFLEQEFLMTYGDGLSNVDLDALVKYHTRLGKIATVTAVRPPARFGSMQLDDSEQSSYPNEIQIALAQGRTLYTPSALIFTKAGFIQLGGYAENLSHAEDMDLILRAKNLGFTNIYSAEHFLIRHFHSNNVSLDRTANVSGLFTALRGNVKNLREKL